MVFIAHSAPLCHPERNEVESKDLDTKSPEIVIKTGRFFDFAAYSAASLRMTCFFKLRGKLKFEHLWHRFTFRG